ncbi:MAG TPA: ECF transporter S component [Anaerovoracaceae bacterium]|nr:ECF transporter S component [Anaerovoracaceae bacterium]
MARTEKTNKVVLTALMMCMIILATMFIKVPTPFTQGYVHLGDAMIFLSVLLLGKNRGALAAGLGSAMADVLGGYVAWAPWTFIIKVLMAWVMGIFIERMVKSQKHHRTLLGVPVIEIIGMVFSGIVMVIGYFVAGGFLYGNWLSSFLGIPWNIGQFAVGVVIATVLATALYKTPARKMFACRLDQVR